MKSPMETINAAWGQSARGGLGIERIRDEASEKIVRASDITVSATAVSNSIVTLATVPDGENWRIEHLTFRNHTASAANLTVYLVPNGLTAAEASNAVFGRSIAADTAVIVSEAIGYQLLAGEKLQCISGSATSFIAFARLTRITQGVAA